MIGEMMAASNHEVTTSPGKQESSKGPFLGILRTASLIAGLAGAVGSFVLMLISHPHAPLLLIVLFTLWVLSPFCALVLASMISNRWPALVRTTLYCIVFILTLASLAIYGYIFMWPPQSSPAAAFTAYAREEDRNRALAAGYQMHVAKPVSSSQLVAMIAHLAGRTV